MLTKAVHAGGGLQGEGVGCDRHAGAVARHAAREGSASAVLALLLQAEEASSGRVVDDGAPRRWWKTQPPTLPSDVSSLL